MGPCVNIDFWYFIYSIEFLIWITGIKTQNTFWANELENATVKQFLLELKHTCYVILF